MIEKTSWSFLVVGKTQDSNEVSEFKRYVGLANSKIIAINPTKKEQDELLGYESKEEPQYVVDGENGKEAKIVFIVRTVPAVNNGIEITNKITFTLRNAPALSQDKSQVTVIDAYGSFGKMAVEDADAKKAPVSINGKDLKVAPKYRKAYDGEAALVSFLKTFLCVPDAFDYQNGAWVINEDSKKAQDGRFELEEIRKYFNGDFSEIKSAIAYQPNSEIKLLYGVRTVTDDEGNTHHYQTICTREGMFLRGKAKADTIAKFDARLQNMKANGAYPTTDFRACELQEWTVEPTNLSTPASDNSSDSSEMPWD